MLKKTATVGLAVFAAVAVAACGGGDDAAPAGGADSGAATTPAPAAGNAIDPANVTDPGSISGTINFGGDAPQPQVLQMAADPFCMTAHSGEQVVSQQLVVNDNGTLRHVFVYIKGGFEGQSFVTATDGVTLNQTGCMYEPHVLGLQTNQPMTILNSDDTLHNVNAQPANNDPFNFAQAFSGMENERAFANEETMIAVKCDVHPWMQGFIGVVSHPYFAVSGEDGSFTISNLPAGSYTVGAWHETLGEQEQSVTVDANGAAEISFDFGS